MAATNPNANAADREKLAANIGRLIILSNEARKRGLPKDPKVHELLRMLQIQELANLLLAQSETQAAAGVTDAEVESFYQEHQADYQSAELIRLTIPRKDPDTSAPEDSAYAESIRTRCSAGEAPEKLEAESFARVGREAKPPEELKNQKSAQFNESGKVIFAMKPGECALLADVSTEFHLYKMVSTTTAPLAEVRSAIVQKLKSVRVKKDLDELAKQHAVRLNSKYFSTPTPAAGTK